MMQEPLGGRSLVQSVRIAAVNVHRAAFAGLGPRVLTIARSLGAKGPPLGLEEKSGENVGWGS
jgi:hypothetical protein